MTREPRVGDRVRIRTPVKGYQPGDKGTVTHAPRLAVHDEPYYVVAMDRDGPTCTAIILTLREIEVDEQS